jgi:hypothetical protein
MATATYDVYKIHFNFERDWTEVVVVCGPASDGMVGVQGRHQKVFPKERTTLSILTTEIAKQDYLLW